MASARQLQHHTAVPAVVLSAFGCEVGGQASIEVCFCTAAEIIGIVLSVLH